MDILKTMRPEMIADGLACGAKMLARKASDNGPTLLAVTALTGLVATAVLAAKCAPKAREALSRRPVKTNGDGEVCETRSEKLVADAKAVIPVMAPAIATGVATAACIVGGNRMQAKRYATLAAAYSITEKAAVAYQQRVVDQLGEDVHDKVMEQVLRDIGEDDAECPFDGGYIVNGNSEGDTLFYDSVTGFCFWSTEEKVRAAEGVISKNVLMETQTICDFYYALGVRTDEWKSGIHNGWTLDGAQIDIRMSDATMEPDGKVPKRVLSYKTQRLTTQIY